MMVTKSNSTSGDITKRKKYHVLHSGYRGYAMNYNSLSSIRALHTFDGHYFYTVGF